MKRKLFIGSSKEGLDVAKEFKKKVDLECDRWMDSEIWDEGKIFTMNKNALDSLVKASRKFDYGVLVATKDDIVKSRGVKKSAPRDNVMLEMGMFLGSLGLTRAFLLVEKESKLPTDYSGVTVPFFQKGAIGSLDDAINKIVDAFKATKSSYNLKPMPSAALALGYFESYIQVIAKLKQGRNESFRFEILLPQHIKDIQTERVVYKNSNPSTEKGIGGPNTRPTAFELDAKPNNYWDIPTTLSTLSKLMDMLLHSTEIGVDREKEDWIDHELRNFAGTINSLVEGCSACRGNVEVTRLP